MKCEKGNDLKMAKEDELLKAEQQINDLLDGKEVMCKCGDYFIPITWFNGRTDEPRAGCGTYICPTCKAQFIIN